MSRSERQVHNLRSGYAKDRYLDDLFERFMRESRNVECPGCGEVGLYEYEIYEDPFGKSLLRCPRCPQTVDLETMMRSWMDVKIQDPGTA